MSKEDDVGKIMFAFLGSQEGNPDDFFRNHIRKCLEAAEGQFQIIVRSLLVMNRLSEEEESILHLLENVVGDELFTGIWLDYDGVSVNEETL